jgi:hypothetical protein
MTQMLDLDAADVATADIQNAAATAERSPNKAAIAYLIAAETTAISVIEPETGCTFRVGTKLDPHAAAVFWIAAPAAIGVARRARGLAGVNPHSDEAVAALRQAAAEKRATLTPHATAMARASDAAKRLETFIETLRVSGGMRAFTNKRRRLAARERGESFLTFKVAEARFKRALIPLLQGGGKPVLGASVFAEVFKTGHRDIP